MVTRAVLRYVRISPRKVRPVIALVKGKSPEEAISILFSVKKKASQYLIDLLESAMANAKRIQGIDTTDLYISNLIANGGPQMKRFRAASMGRASTIRKRTSHITVELDQRTVKAEEPKTALKAGSKQQAAQPKAATAKKAVAAHPADKKANSASEMRSGRAFQRNTQAKAKEPAKPESGKKSKE
jgi:ribosomal protein L22, bacterial type